MQDVIILLYCNVFGVVWMVSGRGSRGAKQPRGGGGAWGFRPGECNPRNFFVFCNSLALNALVLFMYHFALLNIDKILI